MKADEVPASVALTGKLVAKGTAITTTMLKLPDITTPYLPVFTTEDQLRDFFAKTGDPVFNIDYIRDGAACLRQVPTVICDPWFTPENKIRFLQIFLYGVT